MKPQQGKHETFLEGKHATLRIGYVAFRALAWTASPLSCGLCNKGLVWGGPQEPACRPLPLKVHRRALTGKT